MCGPGEPPSGDGEAIAPAAPKASAACWLLGAHPLLFGGLLWFAGSWVVIADDDMIACRWHLRLAAGYGYLAAPASVRGNRQQFTALPLTE